MATYNLFTRCPSPCSEDPGALHLPVGFPEGGTRGVVYQTSGPAPDPKWPFASFRAHGVGRQHVSSLFSWMRQRRDNCLLHVLRQSCPSQMLQRLRPGEERLGAAEVRPLLRRMEAGGRLGRSRLGLGSRPQCEAEEAEGQEEQG